MDRLENGPNIGDRASGLGLNIKIMDILQRRVKLISLAELVN